MSAVTACVCHAHDRTASHTDVYVYMLGQTLSQDRSCGRYTVKDTEFCSENMRERDSV